MSQDKDYAVDGTAGQVSNRLFTVPNILSFIRLAGSLVLIPLALAMATDAFLWLFLALTVTDWLDGKLAILLNQRSVFGARLDSWADAALYAALAFGLLWMEGSTLRDELLWITVALGSYGVSTLAGFVKYRRWPSYHTRAAKISWFLTLVAVVSLLSGWSMIPVHIAIAAITLTNLEALLITWLTPTWKSDVASVFQVWKQR
ncbi:MAG: CDP-diacylglycerol--glycerol-3-phosphate 3-phosphatidyltransferase [Pseudomonadota bacterium]